MNATKVLEEAVAHLNQGQGKKALQKAKAAMRQIPNSPHPYNIAGMSLSALGKHDEAAKSFFKAVKLAPDFPDARRNLAQALILSGRLDKARSILTAHLKSHEDDADAWYLLAQCAFAGGHLSEADAAIGTALTLDAGSVRNRNLRGTIREQMGDLGGAIEDYEAALSRNPMNVETLVNISAPLARHLRGSEALDALQKAVALAPDHLRARLRLALLLVDMGKTAEAIEAFEAVLTLEPDNGVALGQLAQLQSAEHLDEVKARTARALKGASRPSENRAALNFGRATLARKSGALDEEIDALRRANRDMSTVVPYHRQEEEAWAQKICARFQTGMTLPDTPTPMPRPIYVVGLPRSGTTLTEAILGAHPKVAPLGERAAPAGLLKDVIEQDLPFGPAEADAFRAADLARLPHMEADIAAYVDKMPNNYRLIGFLKTAYPDCRIVNMIRDPRDIALSTWRGYFSGTALSYAYDLEAMAHQFNIHARMMQHWRSVFPGQIFDLRYEDLVTDVEGQSRALAAYCDLDWTEAMAEPHRSVSQVMTLSAQQVRAQVNTRSIGGWRTYEAALAPFTDALDRDLWAAML